MKVFQDLTLTGRPDDLNAFMVAIVLRSAGANASDWMPGTSLDTPDYVALQVPARICSMPSTLYLFWDKHTDSIKVTNIVPVARHAELTVDQYNTILQAFYCEFVEAGVYGSLHAELTPESIYIEDQLSSANMELLKHFAQFADKSTGSTHPRDYRRWLAFISARARDQEILDTGLLQAWFIDQGWPSDVASTLVSEYRFGVDLIHLPSAEDTVQDSVSATR
jgi:hypothetical protein